MKVSGHFHPLTTLLPGQELAIPMHRLGKFQTWYLSKVKRKIPPPSRNQNLLFQAKLITLSAHINFVNLCLWFFSKPCQ
jgi:hypothetical protein